MKKKETQTNKAEMKEMSKADLIQINGGMIRCATYRGYGQDSYMKFYTIRAV